MDETLSSCLYECEVFHERFHPKRHRFRYPLFYFDLDLEEAETLGRRLKLFSVESANLYSLKKRDHLDLGEPTLRENIEAWFQQEGITLPPGHRIRLLTLPRILGYIFNPVCFYFVYDSDGHPLHVLIEVCNTFKELKPFLIRSADENGQFTLRAPKYFYVSPFSSLTTEFDFRITLPGEKVEIHIDDVENGETILVSWIRGKRRALTNRNLVLFSFRYPFLTLQVITKIHWQAFRLWLKRIPFHRKSTNPAQQRDLYRPHSSPTENR